MSKWSEDDDDDDIVDIPMLQDDGGQNNKINVSRPLRETKYNFLYSL